MMGVFECFVSFLVNMWIKKNTLNGMCIVQYCDVKYYPLRDSYTQLLKTLMISNFSNFFVSGVGIQKVLSGKNSCQLNTRVGTLIVANIYLQLIQNRYMFRSFTVLQCSHQHCVQPVASDVEVVGYL